MARESPMEEPGYWIGDPAITYDGESGTSCVYYLLRRSRSQGRGYEAWIAASHDGKNFKDIWTVAKQELDNSPPIERYQQRSSPYGKRSGGTFIGPMAFMFVRYAP